MSDGLVERYCGHCGVSLIPLEVPHSHSCCDTCGKTRYFVRPGERGKGIQLEAGESFTIPAEWLTMSFDPLKSRGRLFRSGVPFLLKRLFVSGLPDNSREFSEKLQAARDIWEKELASVDKLAGIDLSSLTGGDDALERLKNDKDSWEWHMLMRDLFAGVSIEAVKEGDAQKAAHCALYTGLFHGLCVVSEPYFEEMVWLGYKAGLAISEAENAADHVPGEVEALAELDPVFRRLGEATLQTWVKSASPIGPRIGVKSLSESLLSARASWHLEEFKREREERVKAPAEQRAKTELWIKVLTFLGGAVGGGVVGPWVTKLIP